MSHPTRNVAAEPFELLCSEVHPTRCRQSLSSHSPEGLVDLAMHHGAIVHGFTPLWYSQARQAAIAAVVARRHR